MTPVGGPLRGRVVLVLGASGRAGEAVALHVSALGAAVVAAGPTIADVVRTAGAVAAAGGTVRVVEQSSPPLPVADVLRLAAQALEPPTDAVVLVAAYRSPADARAAAGEVERGLGAGGRVIVLDAVPAGRERAEGERVATLLVGANGKA